MRQIVKRISAAFLIVSALTLQGCKSASPDNSSEVSIPETSGQQTTSFSAVSESETTHKSGNTDASESTQPTGTAAVSETTSLPVSSADEPLIVTDLENWAHPVKDLFKGYDIQGIFGSLVRVELFYDKTYPVFYTDYVPDYFRLKEWNTSSIENALNKIAIANGYWNYEIRNSEGSITIAVNCDKSGKSVRYAINDYKTVTDFLLNVRDKDFNEYLQSLSAEDVEKGISCSGDLNCDGITEYLYCYAQRADYRGGDYYLLHKNEDCLSGYENLGLVPDACCVGHIVTGTGILQLDKSSPHKYVILYISHDAADAHGYMIYSFNGNEIANMYVNFPGATAHGMRELKDIDIDGIYENIDYYYMYDIQEHLLTRIEPFSEGIRIYTGEARYTLEYLNENKAFTYPDTPQAVVQCFIEAKTLFSDRHDEIADEIRQLTNNSDIANVELPYRANNLTYNGVELKYEESEKLEKSEGIVTLKAIERYNEDNFRIFTLEFIQGKWVITKINHK